MIYITEVRMGREGSKHEHIAAVRWRKSDSPETGESTREEMVDWIGKKGGIAHVRLDNDHDVKVEVVLKANPPYIRTKADGDWTDNLLALPRYGA